MKVVLPLAILLSAALIGGVVWLFGQDGRDSGVARGESARPSSAGRGETPRGPAARFETNEYPEGTPRTEAAASESTPARNAAAEAVPAPEPEERAQTWIEARFVDDLGRALENVRVFERGLASHRGLTQGPVRSRPRAHEVESLAREPLAVSAGDGRVRFAWRNDANGAEEVAWIQAELEGYEARALDAPLEPDSTLDDARTTWLGDVVLAPGRTLTGRVVGVDGAPVPGTLVRVTLTWSFDPPGPAELGTYRLNGPVWQSALRITRPNPDGTFRIVGVRTGAVQLWADAPDHLWDWVDVDSDEHAADRIGLELSLVPVPRELSIHGVVHDPEGRPAEGVGVQVRENRHFGNTVHATAADGAFELLFEEPTTADVVATDPKGRWNEASAKGVSTGTRDLVLALSAPRKLAVAVLDPAGRPVPWPWVQLRREHGSVLAGREAQGDAEGRAEILVPGHSFQVKVFAQGFAEREFGPFEPTRAEDIVCHMAPGQAIAGIVTHDGEPVSGARVTLQGATEPGKRFRAGNATKPEHAFDVLTLAHSTGEATTGSDGRFRLTLHRSGRVVLRAEADGLGAADTEPFVVEKEALIEGIEIELERPGSIAGKVLVAPGREPTGMVVGVSRGDGFCYTRTVGPTGDFRFGGLAPGRWQVRHCHGELPPTLELTLARPPLDDSAPLEWDCTVQSGRTTAFDLDLRLEDSCVIAGSLVWRGRDDASWSVSLYRSDRIETFREVPRVATSGIGGDGSFELAVSHPGRYVLVVSQSGSWTVMPRTTIYDVLELVPGTNPWSLSVESGAVEVRTSSKEAGLRNVWHERRGPGELRIYTNLRPQNTAPGELMTYEHLPTGRGVVLTSQDWKQPHAGGLTDFAEIEVARQGTARIELP